MRINKRPCIVTSHIIHRLHEPIDRAVKQYAPHSVRSKSAAFVTVSLVESKLARLAFCALGLKVRTFTAVLFNSRLVLFAAVLPVTFRVCQTVARGTTILNCLFNGQLTVTGKRESRCSASLRTNSIIGHRSSMARVVKGPHSLTCHSRVYPRFCFPSQSWSSFAYPGGIKG